MREIQIQVPEGRADRVLELGSKFGAVAPVRLRGTAAGGEEREVVIASFPNSQLGEFVETVSESIPDATFVFAPSGVLAVEPPLDDIQRSTRWVETRSPLELVLGSLQSIGSRSGMLTYSALSGAVAAYAVIFNLSFLLVAAMLIAPVGAPAMVTVVGTAIGDWRMVRRGASRFVIALAVLTVSAIVLGLLSGLELSTSTMEQITSLSSWSALMAIVGGAAGAEAQVQSDRDSLVTGTATGFLIAVALSPPAAVLGLAVTIGRWDYVGQMAFNLTLTYAGIILGGWTVLHLNGIRPGATRTRRGSDSARLWTLACAALVLAVLLFVQVRQTPALRKADIASNATVIARDAVGSVPSVRLIEASAHFARGDILDGPNEALISEVWVEVLSGSAAEAEEQVRMTVREALVRRLEDVVPYVQVVAVPGGGAP